MANVNIKQVEGGKVTSLNNADAFEIDTGSTSVYIEYSDFAALLAALTQTLTNKTLIAPAIADFTNAAHDHGDADDGGLIVAPSTSFTPSITNLTIGSGTRTGKYIQIGKLVHFDCSVVFAADTTVGGSLTLALPVAAASYAVATQIGIARLRDASAALSYTGAINSGGTFSVLNASATYATADVLSATVPFTWAVSDEISVAGVYIAA